MSKQIKQIQYNDWSDTLSDGHEDYWAHIGYISDMIALMLEGYRSSIVTDPNNADKLICKPVKYNTIVVESHKEKFGQVRVYWNPADQIQVEQLYEDSNNKNNISLEQFREQCYRQDLLHYRAVYFIMKQCFPHYWDAMSDAADNPELLFENKEEYLKALDEEISKCIDKYRPTYLERQKDFIFNLLKWDQN
jgi:hypothetical protein